MNKIRDLRTAERMSLKELGKMLGLAESTISLYETGKRQPDQDTLMRVADIFNVSLDYLLRGKEFIARPLPPVSDDVKLLVSMFDQLNERQKGEILGEMKGMTHKYVSKNDKSERR